MEDKMRVVIIVLLFLGDFAFTYSLSSMKVLLNATYAYEFALRFADAAPFLGFPLLCAALFTIIFAWLTDCFISKYYVVLVGLICEVISCITLSSIFFESEMKLISEQVAITSIGFMAAYISTSTFRNIMHLECGPTTPAQTRLYIFCFLYTKILARGLPRIFIVLHSPGIHLTNVNGAIVLLGALVYLILILILRGKLKLEPIYFNIWKHVNLCVYFALTEERIRHIARSTPVRKPSTTLPLEMGFSVPSDEVEDHWLNVASPYFPEELLNQSIKFFNVLFFLFPGIFFGISIYYISSVTLMQAQITSKIHTELINDKDLLAFPEVFDMILFPIFEFVLFPFLKKVLNRDLHYLILGYVLLIAATITLFVIQSILEIHLKYLPESSKAYIRIYNDLPVDIIISSYWTGNVEVLPFDVYSRQIFIQNVAEDLNRSLRIAVMNRLVNDYQVNFIEKQCVSYIFSGEGMIRQGISDPTLYVFDRNDKISYYYLISHNNSKFLKLKFIPTTNNRNTSITHKILENKPNSIDPGNYILTIFSIKEIVKDNMMNPSFWSIIGVPNQLPPERISLISEQNYTIQFKPGTMSALVIFRNISEFVVEIFKIHGPVPVDILHTFMALTFSSVGHAVAAVSYFKFLYLEGPEKMRGTVFSILLALSLVGVVICNSRVLITDRLRYSHTLLMMILSQSCILVAIVAYEHFFVYHFSA